MGKPERVGNAATGRYPDDERLHPAGVTQRTTDYAREHLNEMFGKKYPKNFRKEHIAYHKDEPEELAVINYTSGTTSYSKGVMLPYRSLWSNTKFAFEVLELEAGDKSYPCFLWHTCTDWLLNSFMSSP